MTNAHLINSTAEHFETDVLANSAQRPVLVDFWAEWCGPCKSIAPLLEQLAAEYDGRLLVVKVDTDAEQSLAQQYGIRSLPTLMIFRDGEVVEQIIGAQPLSAIKAALEPFLPRPGDSVIPQIEQIRLAGDITGALAAVTSAIETDPDDYRLAVLQADIMLDLGDVDGATSVLGQLPVAVAASDEVKRTEARLALADSAKSIATTDDLGKQFRQAAELAIGGDFEEALEILLELIVQHRDWQEGLLRETIVNIFAQMDGDDPQLKTYRTRLARTLN